MIAADDRPYQAETVEKIRQLFMKGKRRVLIQGETGSGKTEVAIKIAQGVTLKGRTALFLADNRVLVDNLSERFAKRGLPHGVLMAGREYDPHQNVLVVSKQTFLARYFDPDGMPCRELPKSDVVFIDEAHRAPSDGYQNISRAYPDSFHIWLTATPCRSDGKGMGDYCEELICMVPPSRLIKDGYLVPTRVFAPYRPDLKGIRTVDGDYHKKQLQKRMDQPKLVGDIVTHWKRLGEGKPTMICASGIDHSLHIRDAFRKAGISCEHIDGNTSDEQRDDIYGRIKDGILTAFSVFGVGIEGLDLPCLSVCVLARPTKSFLIYRQAVGRVKRPLPGKEYCTLLDHAGCVHMHGMPDLDVEWSLDGSKKAYETKPRKPKNPGDKGDKPDVTCPECFAMHPSAPVCPNCGHAYKVRRRAGDVEHEDGQLVQIDDAIRPMMSREAKVRGWHKFLAIAANKALRYTAASAMFMKEFGHWPDEVSEMPNLAPREDRQALVRDLFPQYLRRKAL